MESGLLYGIYIPTRLNFEGSVELCAGSLAAVNYTPLVHSEISSTRDSDPEYPTDSPHWFIFLDKAKALDVLKQFKEAKLREFPNLEQTERYVQFGFESVQSLKLCAKVLKQEKSSASSDSAAPTSSTQPANNANTSNSGLKASCEQQLSTLSNGEQHTNSGTVETSNGCSPANAPSLIIPSSINICTNSIVNFTVSNGEERPPFRAPTKQELVEFRKTCRDPPDVQVKNDHCDPLNSNYKTPPRIGSRSIMRKPTAFGSLYTSTPNQTSNSMNQKLIGSPMPMLTKSHCRRILFQPKLDVIGSETEPLMDAKLNDMDKCVDSVAMENVAMTPNVGVVNYALADKQNGNHENHAAPEPAQQHEPTILSASMVGAQGDGLFNVTSADKPETNNNKNVNKNIGGSNHSSSSSLEHFEKYGTISLPSTPVRHSCPEMFMTYRQVESSPFVSDLQSALSPPLWRLPAIQRPFDQSVSFMDDSFKERHIKNSDFDKGVEVIGRQLAKQENVEWIELWDFLNPFVDIAQPTGLEKLETYLLQRTRKNATDKKSQEVHSLHICNTLSKCCMSVGGDVAGGGAADGNFQFAKHHELEAAAATTNSSNILSPLSLLSLTSDDTTTISTILQVFAKRIAKTIINNITNVGSINDTLVSELKRLKSLICGFKEDARFYSVDFGKVHSRIGKLVAIYIAHSQEVTLATKSKIQSILRDLPFTHCERREHLECVCAHMLLTLESVSSNELPDLLKTEELCSSAWNLGQSCHCHWDGHLSRKTSRRTRTEAFYVKQAAAELNAAELKEIDTGSALGLALQTENAKSVPRSNNNNNHCNVDDNLVGNEVRDTDDPDLNDHFYIPAESNSPLPEPDVAYKTFIFGDEPTKRDLDVLNAIFHVDIDKKKYPCIHAWKEAILHFSKDEMDKFPSPMQCKRHRLPIGTPTGAAKQLMHEHGANTPLKDFNKTDEVVVPTAKIAGKAKRLLSTPKLQAVAKKNTEMSVRETPPKMHQQKAATSGVALYKTPLHRAPGLFSNYRDTKSEFDDFV